MFGLGMGEILLIAVVALLVLGPDRLPDAAKAIGKGIRDLRKQTKDLQDTIEQDTQIGDAVRELRGALRGDPEDLYRRATGEDLHAPESQSPSEEEGSNAEEHGDLEATASTAPTETSDTGEISEQGSESPSVSDDFQLEAATNSLPREMASEGGKKPVEGAAIEDVTDES